MFGERLKLFTCVDHAIIYPTGGASVIIATSEKEARQLLDAQLRSRGLKVHSQKPYSLVKIDLKRSQAIILYDGDY